MMQLNEVSYLCQSSGLFKIGQGSEYVNEWHLRIKGTICTTYKLIFKTNITSKECTNYLQILLLSNLLITSGYMTLHELCIRLSVIHIIDVNVMQFAKYKIFNWFKMFFSFQPPISS